MEEEYYITLSSDITVFEPSGSLTSVFFDPANQSRGTLGVNVKSLVNDTVFNFRISDQGDISDIKFSEDYSVLAIQRSSKSLDFLNFESGVPNSSQYSRSCRNKRARILGFVWIKNLEILLITNLGLELYQVASSTSSASLTKQLNFNIDWFLWDKHTASLVTSSRSNANCVQFFQFENPCGSIKSLKLYVTDSTDLEGNFIPVEMKHSFLTSIYGDLYFCTTRMMSLNEDDVEKNYRVICMYEIKIDGLSDASHILLVDTNDDTISFSVVDNLILVHYQNKKSMQTLSTSSNVSVQANLMQINQSMQTDNQITSSGSNMIQSSITSIASNMTQTDVDPSNRRNVRIVRNYPLGEIVIQRIYQVNGSSNSLFNSIIDHLPSSQLEKTDAEKLGRCTICMEDYVTDDTILRLPCFHLFHKLCAKTWLTYNTYCPVCRVPICSVRQS